MEMFNQKVLSQRIGRLKKSKALDNLEQVEGFYSKATPQIVDKILIGIYRCMAWTKEDQREISEQFPE